MFRLHDDGVPAGTTSCSMYQGIHKQCCQRKFQIRVRVLSHRCETTRRDSKIGNNGFPILRSHLRNATQGNASQIAPVPPGCTHFLTRASHDCVTSLQSIETLGCRVAPSRACVKARAPQRDNIEPSVELRLCESALNSSIEHIFNIPTSSTGNWDPLRPFKQWPTMELHKSPSPPSAVSDKTRFQFRVFAEIKWQWVILSWSEKIDRTFLKMAGQAERCRREGECRRHPHPTEFVSI